MLHSNQFPRRLALGLAALCLLLVAACTGPNSGIVWKHDTWDGTLSIGEERYVVTRQTKLFGPSGERIRVQDVPTVSDPDIGVRHLDLAKVDFVTWEVSGKRFLDTLWVRGSR